MPRIDDSHAPFKRKRSIGPGPKKAPPIHQTKAWACERVRPSEAGAKPGFYTQVCRLKETGAVRYVRRKKSKKKAGKKDKSAKKKKKAASTKEKAERDDWGAMVTSQRHQINAHMMKAKKPLTAKDVSGKLELPLGRVRRHLQRLTKKKFLKAKEVDGTEKFTMAK